MHYMVVAAALAAAAVAGPAAAGEQSLLALHINIAPRPAPLATPRPAQLMAQSCKSVGDTCRSDFECCPVQGSRIVCKGICLPGCPPGLPPSLCSDDD